MFACWRDSCKPEAVNMKLVLIVALSAVCFAVDATEETDTRAASLNENYGCQCDSLTFRDKYGRINGNCKSADQTGALWCYLPQFGYTTCTDIGYGKTSTRFPGRKWSYEACATPSQPIYGGIGGGSGGIGGCIDRHGTGCNPNYGTGGNGFGNGGNTEIGGCTDRHGTGCNPNYGTGGNGFGNGGNTGIGGCTDGYGALCNPNYGTGGNGFGNGGNTGIPTIGQIIGGGSNSHYGSGSNGYGSDSNGFGSGSNGFGSGSSGFGNGISGRKKTNSAVKFH